MLFIIKLWYVRGWGVYNVCWLEFLYSIICLDWLIFLFKINGIYVYYEMII